MRGCGPCCLNFIEERTFRPQLPTIRRTENRERNVVRKARPRRSSADDTAHRHRPTPQRAAIPGKDAFHRVRRFARARARITNAVEGVPACWRSGRAVRSLEREASDPQRVWTERRIRQVRACSNFLGCCGWGQPRSVAVAALPELETFVSIRVHSWLPLNLHSSEQCHQSRRAKVSVVRKCLRQTEPPHDHK